MLFEGCVVCCGVESVSAGSVFVLVFGGFEIAPAVLFCTKPSDLVVLFCRESVDLGASRDAFGAGLVHGGSTVSGVEDVVPVLGCSGVVDGVASRFASVGAGSGVFAFVGGLFCDEFLDAGAQRVASVSFSGGGLVECLSERGQFVAGGMERAGGVLEAFVGVQCCADCVLGCIAAGGELFDVGLVVGVRRGRSEGSGVGIGEGELALSFGDLLREFGVGERGQWIIDRRGGVRERMFADPALDFAAAVWVQGCSPVAAKDTVDGGQGFRGGQVVRAGGHVVCGVMVGDGGLVGVAAVFAETVVAAAWWDGRGVERAAFNAARDAFQSALAGYGGFVVVD